MEISEKTQKFIKEHCKDDINSLRLKYAGKSSMMDIPIEFALLQIEARRKAQKKIPTFLLNPLFIFPDTISAEQASNETVASFHASLLHSGSSVLDLTAGLGIDDLTFAMQGMKVTACEIVETKADALRHNAAASGLEGRLKVVNTDSMKFVKESSERYDTVFSDPARRGTNGKRLHALSDCQPDILGGIDDILRITDRILIKSSPLLDLTLIRDTTERLSHIYVVCFKGECKEVLIDIEKGKNYTGLTVVDLDTDRTISSLSVNFSPTSVGSSVQIATRRSAGQYKYLYEPNAGIMKTGAWGELADRFPGLEKADANSHLFLSDSLIEGFPGRILTIISQPDKKALKTIKGTKCHVVARNHPLAAQEIAKKLCLIPGGNQYLYAFKYQGKPVYILTETAE